ncbi:flavin reductase family protein [Spiractinospora alimapuensis]|uniref:flavin reductase family protein n=1 Tax=Spiractinospora alimapuensis TaxID=2820884 RepID=UPI001F47E923|nr:flavin reductase family protein [Spiractinospora alimapuensis]QVQ52590.1 flavin reductase family protein [Spiractinospora alimapuensis]
MRTELTRVDLPGRAFYRLLTALVVPRPIAWVSTTSSDGVDNLAPHSFFTVASTDPPIVQFTSTGRKDSVTNAEKTGEFVVSLAPESMQSQINATAIQYPPDTSEFDEVGVLREPSQHVTPPRVADAPAVLECQLRGTVEMGDSVIVFGEVVHAAVNSAAMREGHPEITALRPIARLGRNEWATVGEIRPMDRVRRA